MPMLRTHLSIAVMPEEVVTAPTNVAVEVDDHFFQAVLDPIIVANMKGPASLEGGSLKLLTIRDEDGTAITLALYGHEIALTATLGLTDFRRLLQAMHGYCALMEMEDERSGGGAAAPSPRTG